MDLPDTDYYVGPWEAGPANPASSTYKLFNKPLFWDVSSVTTMKEMFKGLVAFNGAPRPLIVADARNQSHAHAPCTGDISAWDVGIVTDMERMFAIGCNAGCSGGGSFNGVVRF